MVTGRATVIDVARPLGGEQAAAAWLRAAGEPELEEALGTLNRALHAFRVVSADPYLHPVARQQAIVARIGYGAGEQVADGLWAAARELTGLGATGSVGSRAGPAGSAPAGHGCWRRRPAWPPCWGRASGRWPARS